MSNLMRKDVLDRVGGLKAFSSNLIEDNILAQYFDKQVCKIVYNYKVIKDK